MRKIWLLAAVAFSASAAFAQGTTTQQAQQTQTAQTPAQQAECTPVQTVQSCCGASPAFPNPCAAKAISDIDGQPVILVLSSEETYALRQLNPKSTEMNWDDYAFSTSYFAPNNPIEFSHPNEVVSRHGNPYFPYYATNIRLSRVAGAQETYCGMTFPACTSADQRTILNNVANHYRGMSTQEAMTLGYQPMGTYIPNVGQIYINQSIVDNTFDPSVPEALAYDNRGNLVAVHYILLSNVPVIAFGQQMMPSPLVQGAIELPVWMYRSNKNGLFAFQNPGLK